ncbi:hypothetical protein AQZ50_12170 [Novosphingobium sp. Fuku2-ISO-50]|nr:hypothetical protein AQZ50_12170 [Novosphingobium sp. Fuku2-ISO-50]
MKAQRKHALDALENLGFRAQRSKLRQLLHEREFAVFDAYRGVLKAGRIGNATPQSIEELAASLDPSSPTHERVEQREITTNARQREVQAFGPRKRALQLFVADLIRAIHPPRANQYLFHGGIPAAIAAVEAAYQRGMTHAVELDVKAFYDSIPFAFLADVLRPLPKAVVRHVVFDETIRVRPLSASTTIIRRAMVPAPLNETQGIPLGAATSPIAGEVIVGQLLAAHEIDYGPDIITYADNLLVLGRSEWEASARAEHLTDVAARPAYGSLRLRLKERGHLLPNGTSSGGGFSSGVIFAGQFGSVDARGVFSWEPAPDRRLQHQIADGEVCPTAEQIDKALRRVSAFHRAYPKWREREQREARDRAMLTSARYLRLATPENLSVATRDIALACLLNRQSSDIPELVPDYGPMYDGKRQRLLTEAGHLLDRIFAQDTAAEQAA